MSATVGEPFDPGPEPKLSWLPVQLLRIDPSYQRTVDGRISQASIERIANGFRWDRFGIVLVAQTDEGHWLIIDGQHRVEAAKRRGLMNVPCMIVPPMSREQQAQIFLAVNELRVRVNAFALFYARLAAHDADAVDTKLLADRAGLTIPRYPIPQNRLEPGHTLALATVKAAAASKTGTKAVMLVGHAWAQKPGGVPAIVLRAAWVALDSDIAEANVAAWLQRNRTGVFQGANSKAQLGEIVHQMRRTSLGPNLAPGISRDRAMGTR